MIFSRTRSDVGQGTYAPDSVITSLSAELPRHLRATMTALVDTAAREWKPYAQNATVIGNSGDDWIVNEGRSQGLRSGDMLGDDIDVIYAGSDYAVVKPVLGKLSEGQVLSRTVATPAAVLARPSVIVVALDAPEGQAQYLGQVLEDALATKTSLAPVPVNPSFTALRSEALSEAQEVTQDSRSLPEYVAAFSVVPLAPAKFASNIPGVQIARYQAHAFVESCRPFRARGVYRARHRLG